MAEPTKGSQQQGAQPETQPQTITIDPAQYGMTAADLQKLIPSAIKAQVTTKKRDKATRDAFNDLRNKYPTDFDVFLKKRMVEQGIQK